jgi:hypothetical protein
VTYCARGGGECACGAGSRSAESTLLTMSMKRVILKRVTVTVKQTTDERRYHVGE